MSLNNSIIVLRDIHFLCRPHCIFNMAASMRNIFQTCCRSNFVSKWHSSSSVLLKCFKSDVPINTSHGSPVREKIEGPSLADFIKSSEQHEEGTTLNSENITDHPYLDNHVFHGEGRKGKDDLMVRKIMKCVIPQGAACHWHLMGCNDMLSVVCKSLK